VDSQRVLRKVSRLIAAKDLKGAEELLLQAQKAADIGGDAEAENLILSELIELYWIAGPPLSAKAVALSGRRERLTPSAFNTLRTAMILQNGSHDYARAIPKLKAAIAQAASEGDERTIYTSLSMLGQAYLEVSQTEKALVALREIEKMVERKGSFVVGDETCFLEGLRRRGLEPERVRRLASALVAACRDLAFRKRLKKLVGGP
jgi:tetratricopeptide (TPR) repeat protein